MEYRITITYARPGLDPEEGDRALTALLVACPQLGPVVSQSDGRLEVTVARNAPDAEQALEASLADVRDALLGVIGIRHVIVVHSELVEVEQPAVA